jgi:tetratricopeptide (TPR) repeat protein
MKLLFYLTAIFLICSEGYSQTENKKALEFYNNGCYKVSKRNYIGAVVDFSEAIKLDAGFIQAYENRGVAKYYLHDYTEAIADYNKALEINPDDYNTYGRRGWAKFRLQDCTGAIDDFTRALEGNKNNISYYNVRGQAKYYLLDYQGAINDFNKVINSWYSDKDQKSKAYYWRALAKIDLGQKESGCQDLSKSGKLGYKIAYEIMEMMFCH